MKKIVITIYLILTMLFIGSAKPKVIVENKVVGLNSSYFRLLQQLQGNKQEEVVVEEVKQKNYSDEDLYWLSRIVSAEAKGESLKGQIAVANVVLNRSKATGKSVKEVVFEKGQFSPVANKTIYNEPIESAIEASVMALEGTKVVDDKVMYFYAPKLTSRGNWIRKREVHTQIGNHIFSY